MRNFVFKSAFVLVMFFAFVGCSKDSDDPEQSCTPINCVNGGVSTSDCGCDCAIGFTGTNCQTQITPARIKITKIRVTNFPNFTPSGNYWDVFSSSLYQNPDIFPYLSSDSGTTGIFAGITKEDVYSLGNDTFDFYPATPIVITQMNTQYGLDLYDEDTSSNYEFMGGWLFYIYNSSEGFPAVKNIGSGNDNVQFQLFLTYEF
ncbi:MAG: hypothetical protein V4548_12220 [Bacteroidota bacterium]